MRRRPLRICGPLLVSVLPLAANGCLSQADGPWSGAATWTNCGGGIPGAGDTASVQHTVTITQDIGTGLGIQNIQIAGGMLLTDGAAPYTIYFGSTGTDPVGSGTEENPGSDATMFGFLVDSGTLDFSNATPAAFITVTTSNGNFPSFIRHVWGGGGLFAGGTIKLKYTILNNLGTGSPGFEGVHVDGTDGASVLSVDHCYFISPYIAVWGYSVQGASITFNSVTGARGPQTVYMVYETGWTVTDNTETNPAVDGVTFYALYPPSGLNLLRNAALSSATFSRRFYDVASENAMSSNVLVQYNIADFVKTNDSNATGIMGRGENGFFTIADSNVIQEPFQGIWGSPGLLATNNVISTSGPNYNGQGMIFIPDYAATATGNMLALDGSNQGNIGIFSYNGATQISTRNTVVMLNPDNGFSMAICACETGYPSVNNLIKNNITEFGTSGVAFIPASTYIPDYAGSGVHHNDIVNTTYPYGLPATAHGNGFDNGSIAHPNAIYGDMSINPGLVDSNRRLEKYDAFIGGPGSVVDLFAGLANRCGLTGSAWQPSYDPLKIYGWMRAGFSPTEIRLATLADDNGYVGALKPVGVLGAFIP